MTLALVFVAPILPAQAGSWTITYPGTVTIGTGQPFPNPPNGCSFSSEEAITAKITVTYTWSGTGTPPKTLNVLETGSASWSEVVSLGGSSPNGSCSDGLGDSEVDTTTPIGSPQYANEYAGSSSGTWAKQLQVSGGVATDKVTLSNSCGSVSSGGGEVSLSASIPAPAFPVSWTTKGIVDGNGTGTLEFQYTWKSSDGTLADLKGCFIHEYVEFPGPIGTNYQPPAPFGPAWAPTNPNPTITPVPGVPAEYGYGVTDDQNYATPLTQAFIKPYSNASTTATQYWEYDDMRSGVNDIGIAGPITITRTIEQILTGPNNWAYIVNKSGYTSSPLYLP